MAAPPAPALDTISSVNAFAIARDDGIMLVDCGSAGDPSYRDALAAAMDAAGPRLADVRLLVVTHTHSDHVGPRGLGDRGERLPVPDAPGLGALLRRHARAGGDRGRRARGGPARGRAGRPARPNSATCARSRGACWSRWSRTAPADGMRLPSTLGDWEVVETPGHAPSHVCLVQRDRGVAIVGDLVERAFAPYFDYGYSPDPIGELLASYDRVESIGGIRLGLPGHGRPLEDLRARIGPTARHPPRLEEARAAVARGRPAPTR